MANLPELAITLGDVNGVGPEILLKAMLHNHITESCRPIVYGSESVLKKTADSLGIQHIPWPVHNPSASEPEHNPGKMTAEAGAAAMRWLTAAVDDALANRIGGIVTCPISKEGIRAAGYDCMGHTDFIAHRTGAAHYCMSLFARDMRAIHVTGHMPLREALDRLDTPLIVAAIELAHNALHRIGIDSPRIGVAGLNPHAGENRLLGNEDLDIVAPAIIHCSENEIACTGPHPPDTVFWRMQRGDFDMVVALYHDQGHIPMKLVAMDYGVNVTLGVPIVRTSVDHGTAYDIAGKNKAGERSLVEAILLATKLAGAK